MAWIYDHNRRVTKQKVEVPQTLKGANASNIHTPLHWLSGIKCGIAIGKKHSLSHKASFYQSLKNT